MPDYVEIIGVGVLALLILEKVFAFLATFIKSFLSRPTNGNGKTKFDIHEIKFIVEQLKEDVAAQKSDDMTKRTNEALIKIADSLSSLTSLVKEMRNDISELKIAAYRKPQGMTRRKKKH